MVTKAIILAAGIGTRLLPVTKTIEKPMLPIGNKPIIHLLVEQLVASGITDIVFVVNPNSQVQKYFERSESLERELTNRDRVDFLNQIRNLSTLARFQYAVQAFPLGTGDALLAAKPYVKDDEAVALVYSDIFFKAHVPAVRQLMDVYEKVSNIVLAVGSFYPVEKISEYAVLDVESLGDKTYKIRNYIEKPKGAEIISALAPCGYGIITADFFNYVDQLRPNKRGEIEFPDAINLMIKDGKVVYGTEIDGILFDSGSVDGYKKLFCDMANENFS